MKKKGSVFFFTGLSGAGKSTLGGLFYQRLQEVSPSAVLMDGDRIRKKNGDHDYSTESRRRSSFDDFQHCLDLSNQGLDVVICTIAMYRDVRAWAREHIENFHVIYVKVKWETLLRRNQKGLYSPGQTNVVGVDLPWDEPQTPDFVAQNDGDKTPEELVAEIWNALVEPEKPS